MRRTGDRKVSSSEGSFFHEQLLQVTIDLVDFHLIHLQKRHPRRRDICYIIRLPGKRIKLMNPPSPSDQ